MDWGGGVIGWQASSSQYNSHYLSGDSNSNDIGCLYSNTYSAVVFKIDDGKYASLFLQENMKCNIGLHKS